MMRKVLRGLGYVACFGAGAGASMYVVNNWRTEKARERFYQQLAANYEKQKAEMEARKQQQQQQQQQNQNENATIASSDASTNNACAPATECKVEQPMTCDIQETLQQQQQQQPHVPVVESQVIELTPETFKAQVGGDHAYFINFYAPWCGFCQRLMPTMRDISVKFANENSNVKIAQINADLYDKFAEPFNIRGYPTLLFFYPSSGAYTQYRGARHIDSITEWIQQREQEYKHVMQYHREKLDDDASATTSAASPSEECMPAGSVDECKQQN